MPVGGDGFMGAVIQLLIAAKRRDFNNVVGIRPLTGIFS